MATNKEYNYTSNNVVYNKLRKRVLENEGKIICSYCPYHKGENRRDIWSHKSWKRYRKTQYKTKAMFSGEVL